MRRRPFDSGELGQVDPELEGVTAELESYARLTASESPRDLPERVMAGLAAEPAPRRGFLAALLGPLAGGLQTNAGRAVLVAGTMALAVAAVVIAGQLAELFAPNQVGPSPAPSVIQTTTASPSPTPEASTTPSPRPTLAPTSVPSPPPTERPSPVETPEPQTIEPSESPDDEESETPHPSEDNSGPGGGEDDSSS